MRNIMRAIAGVVMLMAAVSPSYAADASLAGAVERMDRAAIRQLIDKRAEINTAQPDGTTALVASGEVDASG